MHFLEMWEMFYVESETDEDLIDQVSIDSVNKRFILDRNVSYLYADSVDREGGSVDSYCVSRFVFDLIIDGLKQRGFKEVVWNDEDKN